VQSVVAGQMLFLNWVRRRQHAIAGTEAAAGAAPADILGRKFSTSQLWFTPFRGRHRLLVFRRPTGGVSLKAFYRRFASYRQSGKLRNRLALTFQKKSGRAQVSLAAYGKNDHQALSAGRAIRGRNLQTSDDMTLEAQSGRGIKGRVLRPSLPRVLNRAVDMDEIFPEILQTEKTFVFSLLKRRI